MSSRSSRRAATRLAAALALAAGCGGEMRIMPHPPDAQVTVDGEPVPGNVLRYGRWVGNDYRIVVSKPGFVTDEQQASVELRDRAGGVALTCFATVLGIPLMPIVLWNGELDERLYVSLRPLDELGAARRE